MRVSVKLPRLGDTVDEVVVMEWAVAVGDSVAEGDVLLRVETDKAVVEVPSPVAGRLVEQAVQEGDEVTTGTAFAVLDAESPESRRTHTQSG